MLCIGRDRQRRVAEKLKAVKWRQWVLLSAIPITGAALVINTIVIIYPLESFASYSNDSTGRFSFYDLPDGAVRSKVIAAVSVGVVLLVALWAETIHFAVFFHRDDHVYRRCTIQAGLSATLVVLAALKQVLDKQLATMPVAFDATTTKRPDLTAEQFNAAYGSWRDFVISDTGLIAFIISVIDAGFHAIVLVFWLWLLPARHRLPNRSESGYELVATAGPGDIGPLEAVFQEHEQARHLNGSSSSRAPKKATQESSKVSISSGGPQFDPIVRYWMVNPLRDGAWFITLVFLFFFTFDSAVEIVFYVLTKTYKLRCNWYCYLAIAYPWPIVLWAIIIAILLRMRVPFDRRIFAKGPRLDVLVTIVGLPFIPVWLLVQITRFTDFGLDGKGDYTDYIESDPGRDRAYGAMLVLKILELSFAFILGICLSVMGHTIYNFYRAGKRAKT
ncbi:hypothetical protein O1611_g7839 [Lasiodiplodia mahajangana]|uniref:Uncharacterized protein n=1 Tax=Lasiodiplodia mahajangana TaxID=1108764 RepID=A0ACC2JEK6_9PEZI|nr:hypothetical protein O1611_g7839 [Lasiodiplodia mahajangana]